MKLHKSLMVTIIVLMIGCNSIPKPGVEKIQQNKSFDQKFEIINPNRKAPIVSTLGIILFTLTLCTLIRKNGNK